MDGTLLDRLLKRFPNAKRQTLKRMVEAGRIRLNGRPATKLSTPLAETDEVEVDDAPRSIMPTAPSDLHIVHEDEDILVLDKPAGLLTSTVPREPRPTLWAMARDFVQAGDRRSRVGLIHRLDRDASGVLVFSKNEAAYDALKSQFFHHTVVRQYAAIVHGIPDPPKGKIETRLIERTDGTVHSTRQSGKGQIAITHYEMVRSAVAGASVRTLLKVTLETGRKHQIRVHLSQRGWPIVGDKVYGRPDSGARLMLAATLLELEHPRNRRRMTFSAAMPAEFRI